MRVTVHVVRVKLAYDDPFLQFSSFSLVACSLVYINLYYEVEVCHI